MTEGMEHLIATYQKAGVSINRPSNTGQPRGWGYREGGAVTLIYRLLSTVDEHGRILAQRWATQSGAEYVQAPAVFPTMIKASRFDRIEGMTA